MIRDQWYVVLESNEIKKGKPVGVTRMGEKLVAWRDTNGKVTMMADKCPHRGVALSAGALKADCIQCPFHGFEFDSSGACTLIPANGMSTEPPKAMKVHAYPTREAHGFIYMWWGEPRAEYPELPFFEAIGEDMVYGSIHDHWKTHYSRAIENQLDVVHLPFVHKKSIGRGNQTIVNGPIYRTDSRYPGDNIIELWFDNAVDSGQTPLKLSQLPEPDRHPLIQVRFPNIWHNWLGDNMHLFIAFTPIDDENTRMYIRYYHRTSFPVLKQIVNFFGNLGNLYIEREDRRVVITQEPKRADLNIGEKLIPGDGPIIAYRKIRRQLIEEAEKDKAMEK